MPTDVEVKSELDLGEASQELIKWAEFNIREDPSTRCQMIADFRDMIYARGECTPHRTDDAFLLRFLRSRKFNLEGAYRLFVNYYDFKEENPQFVEGIGFDLLEKVGAHDVIIVPPYTDQTGKRILLYKIGNWLPEKMTIDDVFSASLLVLELAILEQKAQIFGGICIVDCENISMQHILHMTPSLAHKGLRLGVTSHPMRLEAMHIVNNSMLFELFFNMFRPFLHEKMKERLYFHGYNMESLHKHVDPKCLPEIYGGAHPNYNYMDWIDGFKRNKAIMEELQSLGYDMSK